jgi:hypothetical protein
VCSIIAAYPDGPQKRRKTPVEMSNRSKQEPYPGIPESPLTLPPDFPIPTPTTGTVDDDDDSADERPDENEAPVRERSENIEAPEEFQRDEEDRDADA